MKTLQEIKDEISEEIGKKNWSNMLHNHGSANDSLVDLVAKRYAIEVSKQSLINASENVRLSASEHELKNFKGTINKGSILDFKNIPII